MAGLNETPRQKMIGILYLVLLGLAATNVTEKVLGAFYTISVSLDETSKDIKETTERRLQSFESTNMKTDAAHSGPYFERAKKVKAACEDLYKYMEDIRNKMVTAGAGYKEGSKEVHNREDDNASPHLMTVPGGACMGPKLKDRILQTRNTIMTLMTPEEKKGVVVSLLDSAGAKPKKTTRGSISPWEEEIFGEGIPLTAAICAMSKLEADCISTENSVVRRILSSATQADFTFDDYDVIVIPQSNYVLVGQQYKAEVFLTAFSSTLNPDIEVAGQKLKVEGGKGVYTANATAEGLKKFSATIKMTKASGEVKTFTTKKDLEYMVAKPAVNISADKMRVFYIGVPNPVSISAAGVQNESLRPSISGPGNATLTGDKGAYTVMCKSRGLVTISVSGELERGKVTPLGSTDFKCKDIPLPHILFAGKSSGTIPLAMAKQQQKLFAPMPADFDFDAKFQILSFKMIIANPREDAQILKSNSNSMTSEMSAALNKIKPGAKILFDDIVAQAPDGSKKALDGNGFTAN